ncbi:cyclin-like protein, partial [Suhomyces tanzawaensis NRRL Y-17324]
MSLPQELKARESIHDFIIKLASKLKLDGPTILAATIYVNRFYMRMPISSSKYFVASAAVAISCKLNDTYRVPDKIALSACNLKNPNPAVPIDEQSDMFWRWRDQLLYREEMMLKTLNFDLNLELPYEIRDELLSIQDPDDTSGFHKKKADILKNTVSLLEVISSLPVLVCYDIYTLFGTLMIAVILEGRIKFDDDSLILPENYMIRNLGVEMELCWLCYKYIIKLLKASEEDPAVISNKVAGKRLREVTEEAFMSTVKNASI